MKRLILMIFSAVLIFCGCTEISDSDGQAVPASASVSVPEAYPVTVDNLTFNESPKSVGSLSPAVTEMICELGFGDRLVCRSSYCDYPDEAQSVPAAGSGANPDFDRIIELRPALLITHSPIANKDVSRLSDAGIAVMIISAPSSVEELCEMYEKLSLIFSGSLDGKELADNALSDLRTAINGANGSCESLIFIMNTAEDGFMAATGDTFAGDYISSFGKNTAAAKTGYFITAEELISADPQVIFLAHPLESEDIDPEVASQLSAFENGHVYVIDGSLMERPTSRLAGITRSISETVRNDTGGSSFSDGYAEIPAQTSETSDTSE